MNEPISKGKKSYLSAREKYDLLNFLAATGENYNRYLEWCANRGVQVYSEKYLHTWIQRRRGKFQLAREKHKQEVRKLSMFDKEKRITELEEAVRVIGEHMVRETSNDHMCSNCGKAHTVLSAEVTIKLMEQKRKLLEAIAKERNEWLKEAKDDSQETTRDRLRSSLAQALSQTKQTQVINGGYTVVVGEGEGVLSE